MRYSEEEMKWCQLPPGFRFYPTDEELINYYLRNQAAALPCPAPIIPEVNIYKFNPWELPGKSELCEGEWYFFTLRQRKFPNGTRPNRATGSGYWKATGTDKAIYSRSRYVGLKKALVFYQGKPPKGSKTDWIMHEYRLGTHCGKSAKPISSDADALDEWVLCRIYQKRQHKRYVDDSPIQQQSIAQFGSIEQVEEEEETKASMLPRPCSLAHLLDPEYSAASLLFDDGPLGSIDDIFSCRNGTEDNINSLAGLYNSVNFANAMLTHESSVQQERGAETARPSDCFRCNMDTGHG